MCIKRSDEATVRVNRAFKLQQAGDGRERSPRLAQCESLSVEFGGRLSLSTRRSTPLGFGCRSPLGSGAVGVPRHRLTPSRPTGVAHALEDVRGSVRIRPTREISNRPRRQRADQRFTLSARTTDRGQGRIRWASPSFPTDCLCARSTPPSTATSSEYGPIWWSRSDTTSSPRRTVPCSAMGSKSATVRNSWCRDVRRIDRTHNLSRSATSDFERPAEAMASTGPPARAISHLDLDLRPEKVEQ